MYTNSERELVRKIRQLYARHNQNPVSQRVHRSKFVEDWIVEMLNQFGVPMGDRIVRGWRRTSGDADRRLKQDAYATLGGRRVHAQVKYRQPDSGTDIGFALIQPYVVDRNTMRWLPDEEIPWARDYQFTGEVFADLSGDNWETLHVIPDFGAVVRPLLHAIFREWVEDEDGFDVRQGVPYTPPNHPGCQLRFKMDGGRGHDAGLTKVICYIQPETLHSWAVAYDAVLPSADLLRTFWPDYTG